MLLYMSFLMMANEILIPYVGVGIRKLRVELADVWLHGWNYIRYIQFIMAGLIIIS